MSGSILRKELGDFNSIICFRSVVTGLEKIMGTAAARGNLIRAGRLRGVEVVQDLGLSKTNKPLAEWSQLVGKAIGKDGTQLCTISNLEKDGDIYRVYLSETICSAGEEQGSSRELSFTQGAILGAVEEASGLRLSSKQTGSVLRGDDFDIVELKTR